MAEDAASRRPARPGGSRLRSVRASRRDRRYRRADLLDSPEVGALIEAVDGLKLRKRRGYGTRALIGACLVRTFYALPTWTRTVRLIEEHAGLADVLDGTPSDWACYRFMSKLREHSAVLADCVDRLAESLHEELPSYGADVAIDASDLPAYANGQRFLYNPGPERQAYSDPDASWGHRSAVSTRKGGGYYRYKLHLAVCTRTGLPLAWRVETARRNESLYVAPLLDALHACWTRRASTASCPSSASARVARSR